MKNAIDYARGWKDWVTICTFLAFSIILSVYLIFFYLGSVPAWAIALGVVVGLNLIMLLLSWRWEAAMKEREELREELEAIRSREAEKAQTATSYRYKADRKS